MPETQLAPVVSADLRSALISPSSAKKAAFSIPPTLPRTASTGVSFSKQARPPSSVPRSTKRSPPSSASAPPAASPSCPQGGNTNMVIGATPGPAGNEIVVMLSRMNKIREPRPGRSHLDHRRRSHAQSRAGSSHSAKAACVPLTMGSEGSAQIGGVLSTNAGGNNTLRYGNARDLVLGLEVVLPDGSIWNGLRRLRKDNTGYCLRQLFVGAEGTLGIITAAVLKLVPRPRSLALALLRRSLNAGCARSARPLPPPSPRLHSMPSSTLEAAAWI